MANPPCMNEDGRPAVLVATLLETGDAVALCDECIVPWAAAMLNALTGLDPTPFLAAISDDPAAPGPSSDGDADSSPDVATGPEDSSPPGTVPDAATSGAPSTEAVIPAEDPPAGDGVDSPPLTA